MSSFLSAETANLKRISSSAAPRFHPSFSFLLRARILARQPYVAICLLLSLTLVSRVASMRLCYSRLSHDDQQSLLSRRAQALTEIASPAHSDNAVIPRAQRPVTQSSSLFARCLRIATRKTARTCTPTPPLFIYATSSSTSSTLPRTCLYRLRDPRFIGSSLALLSLASCRSTLLPESEHN